MLRDYKTGRTITEEQGDLILKVRALDFLTEGEFSTWPSWEDSFLFKFRGTRFILLISTDKIRWYDLEDVKKKPFLSTKSVGWMPKIVKFYSYKSDREIWPPFISPVEVLGLCEQEYLEHLIFNLDIFSQE